MNRRSFFKRMFCGVAAAVGLPLASEAKGEHKNSGFDAREAFDGEWKKVHRLRDVCSKVKYKTSPTWIACTEEVYAKLEKLAKEKAK